MMRIGGILVLMMMSKEAGHLECLRCGHEWLQRGLLPPRQCPNCKNPKWNIERKQTTEEKVQAAYERAGVRKPVGKGQESTPVPVVPVQLRVPEQKSAAGAVDRVCPGCGGKLTEWGSNLRCVPCGRNFGR